MYYENNIWAASSKDEKLCIIPKLANRHGLIAGATGTGKTVSLKVLAESFSDAGVPVFLADVKGDLAGMCIPGSDSEDMKARKEAFGLNATGFEYRAYPVCFWDISGKYGLPVRTTVSEFGPLLFSRLLELNQVQTDILNIVFRIADEEDLLLLDLKDLRAMLGHVDEHSKDYRDRYGNISTQSIGTIMRSLVALEDQGGNSFFGEPALNIKDWFQTDSSGRGMINILDSREIISHPFTYATFMLWMLSELYEIMPEVGDQEKPKMVFFFDEAHLLFEDAPKAFLQKIEQVMKLIRSKGIGVFFITQNPSDIPGEVLAQLGNKVQHALHAYTPAEQKGIKAAAQSFRVNPEFKTEDELKSLGIGEALVSFLDEDGSPAMVKKANMLPPQSKMGSIDEQERESVINKSNLKSIYSEMTDRESAYEILASKAEGIREEQEKEAFDKKAQAESEKKEKEDKKESAKRRKTVASVAGSAVGTVGRELGNEVGKTIGGTFGKRIGGNVGASLGRGILKTLLKF